MNALLTINHLSIEYRSHGRTVPAVHDLTLSIAEGKTLGLVGKSGCGKSTVGLALMGLLPEDESTIIGGTIFFQGRNLLNQTKDEWRLTRGRKIAMVFQDPFSCLNPVFTVGRQIQEAVQLNPDPSFVSGTTVQRTIVQRTKELLTAVQFSDVDRIYHSYPHQLSGGQRQRAMMAIALAQNPALLIADEPTTALDVTVQAEIMSLLRSLQKEFHMTVLFITHNLGLVKGFADNLAVMFKGQIVEQGPTGQILSHPQHPYTQGLLHCIPKLAPSKGPIPLLADEFMEA